MRSLHGTAHNCTTQQSVALPWTTEDEGLSTRGALLSTLRLCCPLLLTAPPSADPKLLGVCENIPLSVLQQATDNWSESLLLGSGGFADVYKAVSPSDPNVLWAVKRARVFTTSFQKEVLD